MMFFGQPKKRERGLVKDRGFHHQHNKQLNYSTTRNAPSPNNSGPSLLYQITFVVLLSCIVFLTIFLNHDHTINDHNSHLNSLAQLQAERKIQQKQQSTTTTIAYAISLIKCDDKQSTSTSAAGSLVLDAALVLRHSIHLQSSRNAPQSGSRYDYKMYAIVHKDAIKCSLPLRQAGFTIVVKDPPIIPKEIVGSDYLRNNIHQEKCCGHDEFIKLYAYELPGDEPIVVHVDIDFAFYKPMDDLYDAILYPKDSPQGKVARSKIPLERQDDILPVKIDAFITRDYSQLIPGRIPGYQAGFLVATRDTTVVPELLKIIRTSQYDSDKGGWGNNKGYGGYVGAMAMQGLMAYFYDVIRPNTAVEVNSCRFNHMGIGKCRSKTRTDCQDCTTTSIDQIYNVHYTSTQSCRKPWNCVLAQGMDSGKGTTAAIDTTTTTGGNNLDHCLALTKKWHTIRQDMEATLFQLTGDKTIVKGALGGYRKDLYLGHCQGEGQYLQLQGTSDTFSRIPSLYGDAAKATTHHQSKQQQQQQQSSTNSHVSSKHQGNALVQGTSDDTISKIPFLSQQSTTNLLANSRAADSSNNNQAVATIAYVFTIPDFPCGSFQSFEIAGLIDSAMVLRHSIHQQSIRNNDDAATTTASGSRYDYNIYAIVNKDLAACIVEPLEGVGFTVIQVSSDIVDPTTGKSFFTAKSKTSGVEFRKSHIDLYGLNLLPKSTEPVVVIMDVKSVIHKPLDHLFDAMLLKRGTTEWREARIGMALERPDDVLPETINAYMTQNYTHVEPGVTKPALRIGFLVVRRSQETYKEISKILEDGNYVSGGTTTSGWGGSGIISRDLDGLLSYYFGVLKKETTVELSSCRFAHDGMDNLYRADPHFKSTNKYVNRCRSMRGDCEDCKIIELSKIYVVRHTDQCQLPWRCISKGKNGGNDGSLINTASTNLDHCLLLTASWHEMRASMEQVMPSKVVAFGKHKKTFFKGHCAEEGAENYLPFYGKREANVDIYRHVSKASAPEQVSTTAETSHQSTTLITTFHSKVKGADASKKDDAITIAYAIAILECNPDDKGLLDSLVVLQHSIYLQSIHNPGSASKYDCKLYAILPKGKEKCSQQLQWLGFDVVVEEPPPLQYQPSNVQKNHDILSYGSSRSEFLQLHAYNHPSISKSAPEPIIVLMDPETAIFKPLDDLFDAILMDGNTPEGKAARNKIPLERKDDELPQRIEAMFARDYHYAEPESDIPRPYQVGFLVIRRDGARMKELLDLAKDQKKLFVDVGGDKTNSGWGGKGYIKSGMSGLIAYYYDNIRQGVSVELNTCRFNHIGMDNLYRALPAYKPRQNTKWIGKCRSMRPDCEECLKTPLSDIYVAHFSKQCQLPRSCVSKGEARGGSHHDLIDIGSGRLEHCLELNGHWHILRQDLESMLYQNTKDEAVRVASEGKHNVESFKGHCATEGVSGYQPIGNLKLHSDLIATLYDKLREG